MRSLVVVFAAVLVGSLAACAVAQDDSGSTADDFSGGRPGTGRRPVGPVIAADDEPDAAPPATALAADVADGGAPGVPVDSDAEAPPVDPGDPGSSGGSGSGEPVAPPPASDDGGSVTSDPDAG